MSDLKAAAICAFSESPPYLKNSPSVSSSSQAQLLLVIGLLQQLEQPFISLVRGDGGKENGSIAF